jgi:glucuronokinase
VTAIGRAHARAALLGNPSDGYGGKAISFAIRNFAAEVELEEGATGYSGPPAAERLIAAAVKRFRDRCETLGIVAGSEPFGVRCRSTIPREVGLGGSSAIVIAALRALGELYRVSIPQEELPSLALSVETEELGIAAGLQDRVAQTYEGLTYMDLDPALVAERGHGLYEPLDPGLLPPLFVAYRAEAAAASAAPHTELRRRYERGEAEVVAAMGEIAELAERGRQALLSRDRGELRRLVDRNFDARSRLYPLDPRHVRMVEVARSLGASANYTGSGGAIVAVPPDGWNVAAATRAFRAVGCGVLLPTVA